MLPDLRAIDPENISLEALDEFQDGDDLETSIWSDGEEAQRRRDVILSLILARQSIGTLSVAMLWQDDENIGADLGGRIVQSDGLTPYLAGRDLHYHVSYPKIEDASRLLLAVAKRKEIFLLTREIVFDLLEDAFLESMFEMDGLHKNMQREVAKFVQQRFIQAHALRTEPRDRLFDLRESATEKIVGAKVVTEKDLAIQLHRLRIGKEDVFTLYCSDGSESKRIARSLRPAKKPRILVGGYNEWVAGGFEIESSSNDS